jgi:hypothetical protein
MAQKVLVLDLTSGRIKQSDNTFIESIDVFTSPTASGIPRADGAGFIDPGWIGGIIGISHLPVASDGEVSSTELVRADDSRLVSPAVGGDIAGTANAATVIKLQSRNISNAAPVDGDVIGWNDSLGQWEPTSPSGVGGGSGGTDVYIHAPVRAYKEPVQVTDGSRTVFTLPDNAVDGSVSVFEKLTGETSYKLVGTERVQARAVTDTSLSGSITSSAISAFTPGTVDKWFDDSTSTACGFNTYGTNIDASTWVTLDFGSYPKAVIGGTIVGHTSGGWSPPRNHVWKYSDNGSTYSTAASGIGPSTDGERTVHYWYAVGAHRYWRLEVLDNWVNSGGYATAMKELEFLVSSGEYATQIMYYSAPASTTKIVTLYEEYDPTLVVVSGGGGGGGSGVETAGGLLYLFDTYR